METRRERLARIAQGYTDDDPIIQDARNWLLDAFGDDDDVADYIENMSALEVILSVDRYFGGGWEYFVETSVLPNDYSRPKPY